MLPVEYNNKEVTLGIVVIAKNESDYILEWIAFHKAVGVQRIYLYDNESTDNMREIIRPFIDDGFVIYKRIEGTRKQLDAYNDAIRSYSSECKYLAFIDCDEFLFPTDPSVNIIDELETCFNQSKNIAGIAVNWVMYGSSNHISRPSGYVIDNFLYRAVLGGSGTQCVKTIIKTGCVRKYINPHYPSFKFGYYKVSASDSNIVPTWYHYIEDYKSLRINHYFTKSKEEWEKRHPGGKSCMSAKRTLDDFNKHDNNEIYDDSAVIYKSSMDKIISNYEHKTTEK